MSEREEALKAQREYELSLATPWETVTPPGDDRGQADADRQNELNRIAWEKEESPYSYISYKTGEKVVVTNRDISGGTEAGTDRGDARVASGEAQKEAEDMAAWTKRYNEDPEYRAWVIESRGTSNIFERAWDSFTDMAEGAYDAAVKIAPTAAVFGAAMYGGSLLAESGGLTTGGLTTGNALATDAMTMNAPFGGPLYGAPGGGLSGFGNLAQPGLTALSGNALATDAMTMNAPFGGPLYDSPGGGLEGFGNLAQPGLTALDEFGDVVPEDQYNADAWMNPGGEDFDWDSWWGEYGNGLLSGVVSPLISSELYNDSMDKAIDENARQYDQTRADYEPYRLSGENALSEYENRIAMPVEEFEFNLEDDEIYQFQRDEALRASTRKMNSGGFQNSGNILTELQKTATGEAGRYQNDAYNRQFNTSNANYGREFDRTNEYGYLAGLGMQANAGLAQAAPYNNNSDLYLKQGEVYNDALQGGINNYLTYDAMNKPYQPGNYYQPRYL